MAFNTLATLTKVTIAGVVAGGIAVAGITFTGDKDITNIKGNLDSMQEKLSLAVADNEFVSEQFNKLQGLYGSAVNEANTTISGLKADRANLMEQVKGLESSLTAKQEELDSLKADGTEQGKDLEDARDELQAEISRLEGELDKANTQIAELAVYAEEADAVEYEAVDREAYNVSEKEVEDAEAVTVPDATPTPEATPETPEVVEPEPEEVVEPEGFVSAEATALNAKASAILGDEYKVERAERGFSNSYRVNVDLKKLSTYTNSNGSTFLAYTVTVSDMNKLSSPAPQEMSSIVMESGQALVYFIDEATGQPLFTVNKNGQLTKI